MCVLFACSDPDDGGQRGRPSIDAGADARTDDAGGGGTDGSVEPRSCAEVQCDPNAICDDDDGTAECVCNPGFTLDDDGVTCNDVDECATDNGGCDEHAVCVNRPGFRRCVCEDGFEGDGESCTGTDECADVALNTCDPNATCSDEEEGFSCSCGAGTSGDGFSCADVDECADPDLYECAANASCSNRFGGYECECDPLYAGDGATQCRGLCEIAAEDTSVCHASGRCRIARDAAVCDACDPGFVGDGVSCTAAGDCPEACDGDGTDDVANTVCSGDSGARTCACAPGYTGDPNTECTDVDECAATPDICGENAVCIDVDGGYFCDCADGYAWDDGAGACVDIDECARDPGPCHPNALCTNNAPRDDDPNTPADETQPFICTCRPGYEGDGSVCRDIDECAEEDDNCLDDGTARCVNTAGSFECRCLRGYTGDGVTECTNVNECTNPDLNDCADNATCTDAMPEDNPLGYDCTCPEGLGGDGTECTDINECQNAALNDCARFASCINEPGGYRCECLPPFAGEDEENCYCDLSGYWAMRQDVDACWCNRDLLGVTVVAGGAMEATTWELHRYSYDGETLRVEKMGCGADNWPDFYSPHFDETYSSYVPDATLRGIGLLEGQDVEESGIVPGRMFTTPDEAAVLGIDLGDAPVSAPWPASFDEINAPGGAPPAWVDHDDDGVPGVTLWPVVPSKQTEASTSQNRRYYDYIPVDIDTNQTNLPTQRAGCVSAATRVITHLEADVQTCNRIVGEVVSVKVEGRVHACTLVPEADWIDDISCDADDWEAMERCDDDPVDSPVQRLDDQDQQQQSTAAFELIKIANLDDPVDCDDVRAALPAYVREAPTPITCDCP